VLNQIGYKASLKPLSQNIEFNYIQNTNNKVQISVTQWFQDYPAASDFSGASQLQRFPQGQRQQHQHFGSL